MAGMRPPTTEAVGGQRSALGAPSAGLSLVGLRPRRARLRFTRRREGNNRAFEEQEEGHGPTSEGYAGVPLNPGGSVLLAEVGPDCAPIASWLTQGGKGRNSRA